MVSHPGGGPIINIYRINDVLIVENLDIIMMDGFYGFGSRRNTIMTIFEDMTNEVNTNVQRRALFDFHRCMGHLYYDTIIKMARKSASGIKLTDTKRVNFLDCAHG